MVKRQIYRALDIVKTVKKVMGAAPKKIFVEMARGGTPDQKGKRTKSRYDNLIDLYHGVRDKEVKEVDEVLEQMGQSAHNRLQADALYLWMLQLGRCAYCGKPLPVEGLKDVANIDHIHPQSKVKDDSVMNNKVLCCSSCNGAKHDIYPVPHTHRQESLWTKWRALGLMTEEKYRRLMRREALTEADLMGFINRQLVETRQTTKAVFTVLREILPETEMVAVKAGNVSDFRHEFGLVKCRAVNDLHHAKDAYLNIVVGNVYHERFSRQFFRLSDGYSMKVGTLFGEKSRVENARGLAWNGIASLQRVKDTVARNDIHLTRYAFYEKGELFNQMPKMVGVGAIPRKKELDTSRYGGYAKPKAAGFLPVGIVCGKKKDVVLMPVNLVDIPLVKKGEEIAKELVRRELLRNTNGDVFFPLGLRLIKLNTVLSLDGFPYAIAAKTGDSIVVRSLKPLILNAEIEGYVKRLESISEKMSRNRNIQIDVAYDKVSSEQNLHVYDTLTESIAKSFSKMPSSQAAKLVAGRERFANLSCLDQIRVILNVVSLVKTNRAGECDLRLIGGAGQAGKLTIRANVSAWKKSYKNARIVFSDFSGMFHTMTQNLLGLL